MCLYGWPGPWEYEGCHACNQEPICQAQCSQAPIERSGHEGEPLAGWLTSPCPSSLISSHFVPSVIYFIIYCKLPGATFKILPGSPEIAWAVAPAISGFPGLALGCLYGASQNHVNFFRAPDGLYFPDMYVPGICWLKHELLGSLNVTSHTLILLMLA